MSRLGGSKLRGAGEQQEDRRHIRKRIQDSSQLAKVEKTRQLHSQRRQRQGLKTASGGLYLREVLTVQYYMQYGS